MMIQAGLQRGDSLASSAHWVCESVQSGFVVAGEWPVSFVTLPEVTFPI